VLGSIRSSVTGRLDEVRVYGRALSASEIAIDRDLAANKRGRAGSHAVHARRGFDGESARDDGDGDVHEGDRHRDADQFDVLPDRPCRHGSRDARLQQHHARGDVDAVQSARRVDDLHGARHDRIKDRARNLAVPVTWEFLTGSNPALPRAYGFSEGTGTTAADSSGNGNTATLTSASLWSATGKHGKSLSLAGGSDVRRRRRPRRSTSPRA